AVVGEVDVEVDESIQLSSVRAAPLKPVRFCFLSVSFYFRHFSRSRSSPRSRKGPCMFWSRLG
ncbi:putative U6 snRNA-associated Sm family protein LSm8, partial [Toxoplasma gondii MAS]